MNSISVRKTNIGISIVLFIFILFFFTLSISNTNAATYYWVGTTTDPTVSASTSNPANWNTVAGPCVSSANVTVPTTTDTINFVSNCVKNAIVDVPLSVDTFTMNAGYTGTTTVNANSTTTALNVDGGTLNIINANKFIFVTTSSIGNSPSSNGIIIVDGVGTILESVANLIIGNQGIGVLNIKNGAVVNNQRGYIANIAGSSGIVNVNGEGSIWANSYRIYVGQSGTGILNIENGAVVSSVNTDFIGNNVTGIGTVNIDGTGSEWMNTSGNINIGVAGIGTLNLIGNSELNATNTLQIAVSSGSTGILNIGTSSPSGTVIAATTTSGLGTSTINFNHTDTSYTFSPIITGPLRLNHIGTGTTTLSGANTYTGTTTLTAGTLVASSSTAIGSSTLILNGGNFNITGDLNVSRDWENNGATINPGSSNVIFSGTSTQTIKGSNTWNNLTLMASSSIVFPSTLTQTINGIFTAIGSLVSPITLRASTSTSQWNINPIGSRSISYVDVMDSNNTNSTPITAYNLNITDSGNNTNWTFTEPPVVIPPVQTSSSGSSGYRYTPPVLIATTTKATTTTYIFTRDLTIGSTGTDVMKLQQLLNAKGYTVSNTGPGSKGNETNYFGNKTKQALIKYQKANNIYPPFGYFGRITRGVVAK